MEAWQGKVHRVDRCIAHVTSNPVGVAKKIEVFHFCLETKKSEICETSISSIRFRVGGRKLLLSRYYVAYNM